MKQVFPSELTVGRVADSGELPKMPQREAFAVAGVELGEAGDGGELLEDAAVELVGELLLSFGPEEVGAAESPTKRKSPVRISHGSCLLRLSS